MKKLDPIIIIGISRSGTTLLTQMLEHCGLFTGKNKNIHLEAFLFNKLNRWLVNQCSGGLENPSSIKYLLDDSDTRKHFREFVRFVLKSYRAISFLGFRNYIKFKNIENLDFPWGWKDPLTTYTVPFWLDIFPKARVIHIVRHPLDVINSLMRRREKGMERLKSRHSKFKFLYYYFLMLKFISKQEMFIDMRCSSYETGFEMWKEYFIEARKNLKLVHERGIEIKFEDLLINTEKTMADICNFCRLQVTDVKFKDLKSLVNHSRAYSYKEINELLQFEKIIKNELSEYGY